MTFEELGATLRAEREKKHLSIEDVANQLKINPRLLCALESGDSSALPHPAYARGFIRSYASLLGFGNDEIQAWLADLTPGTPAKTRQAAARAPEPEPAPAHSSGSGGKIFAAFLIMCGLVGAGYWFWQSEKLPFLEIKKEKPADLVKNLPSADTYQAERPPQAPVEPLPEVVSLPPPALPEPEPVPEPEEAAEPEPDQHKLIIVATEECWVHSNADKTDTRQFSLRKGDTFALTFAKSLELKLGNAGGVRLRYDGNDLPAPGTSGQVRTLLFPPKDS